MSRSASPLRYPGGKACLFDLAVDIISFNRLQQRDYIEPYSGGCGLALSLLFSGHVTQIHLNDIDRSIWAFWKSVTSFTDEIVDRVAKVDVTVDEWHRQREVQNNKGSADILDLGFSTFFLNRTNRSGVIHSGGIIGGKDQAGNYKIDCRFNKIALIERILRISKYANKIHVYNEDAELFMDRVGSTMPANSMMYIDPPYFEKGSQLYKNSYKPFDHSRIAERIATLTNPWFLTYDNVEPIRKLYETFENIDLNIGYSIQTKRRGSELLVCSPDIRLPVFGSAVAH